MTVQKNKIKKMNELLSSKIAAGEVVDRPASVVKELMENAIDSDASRISVYINEGGKRLIRVVDNGSGILPDDLRLCFERFATSKLTEEADLDKMLTMGFRGEALSSIASVSRVTLTSRPESETSARLLIIEGGTILEERAEGAPVGTSVEVSDLFYNTPVRAKFLRTAGTEFARITDIFKKIALAYPERGFKLIHGSSRVIEASPGTLRERVAEIYGKAILKELIEIDEKASNMAIKISGLIGNPSLTYPTGKGITNYINKRVIRDAGLSKAAIAGYSSLIERGRYPFTLLFIEIETHMVDVNVHPAKNEVRFKDPGGVFEAVKIAVNRTLGATSFASVSRDTSPSYGAAPSASCASNITGRRTPSKWEPSGGSMNAHHVREAGPTWQPPSFGSGSDTRLSPTKTIDFTGTSAKIKTPEFLEMEFIGQVWSEFMLCEGAGGNFFIIDQHGAAERARFEKLKKEYYSSGIVSQLLLIPERIETDAIEKEALLTIAPELNKLGFEIVPFGPSVKKGGETFMIKSSPAIFSTRSVSNLISDLTEELSAFALSNRIEDQVDKILMTIACHSVIRGPRRLTKEEATALLKELAQIDFAAHCPHGRPVIKKFSRNDIEAIFKRI